MVGAVTTLIVIVAVFLAYNANSGLPFVPVYRVSVEIPDAARLTNNNEVRIGGHRVGVVESIDAIQSGEAHDHGAGRAAAARASATTGGAVARLNLKLDKAAEPLPKDSVFRVRYRSSFGLKYLEIIRGEGEAAPEGFTFNGTDDGADLRAADRPGRVRELDPRRGEERLLPDADRVRRHQQHLRHRDADQRAHEPGRLRQRLRRPRHLAQRRDRQPRAAVPRAEAR